MARPLRVDYEGAVHHVYVRGNERQAVFRDDHDRRTFLSRVLHYQGETGVRVLAYCLMLNHFHLVTRTGHRSLQEFMQRLETSYTRIFNDRWNRVGHLFQGRYGDRLSKTDSDTMGLIRYVHKNPVEAGLIDDPADWNWSSHRGILAGHDPIADAVAVLELFGGIDEYSSFMAMPSTKEERPSLESVAINVVGSEGLMTLRSGTRTAELASLRREFAVLALAEGYRRSDVAKYLNRTRASITKLIGGKG